MIVFLNLYDDMKVCIPRKHWLASKGMHDSFSSIEFRLLYNFPSVIGGTVMYLCSFVNTNMNLVFQGKKLGELPKHT
jgi:hypothetical protein